MNRTRRTSGTSGRSRVNRSALHQGPRPGTVLPHQRRAVDRLMADAGITARTARIRPGAAELHRVTGARTPSGVPVTIPGPVTGQREGGGSDGRHRRGRAAGQGGNGRAACRARRSAPGPTT
ncbi:hypothetical protein [Streptomyces sasae]|uniref:hypothetical protein n=1 Tax=Streptomyces sasae TaxID=1266772 RepID=UPI00293109D2|nr:hypothetical protein [Streptomyces sasae]